MFNKEELDKIAATVSRLEKAGTISAMMKGAPELSGDDLMRASMLSRIPGERDDFESIRNSCMFQLAIELEKLEKAMSKCNYFSDYVHSLYNSYKENERYIKHPDILKFIKDYEEFYMKEKK